jgi:hypothetical protein
VGNGAVFSFNGEGEWEGVDMAGSINTVLQLDDIAVLNVRARAGQATSQAAGTGRRGVLECQRQNGDECAE